MVLQGMNRMVLEMGRVKHLMQQANEMKTQLTKSLFC